MTNRQLIEKYRKEKSMLAVKLMNFSLKSDSKEYQDILQEIKDIRAVLETLEGGSRKDHLSKQIEDAKNAGIKAKVIKGKPKRKGKK